MTPVETGTVVGIFAEGKTHALAVSEWGHYCACIKDTFQVGKTSMSTKEIAEKNKGVGVENYHYLNDGLWNMKHFKQ